MTARAERRPVVELIPRVGLGTSPLGGSPAIYGYDVDDSSAQQALARAFARGVLFVDTAREYGRSEDRIGRAIAAAGGPPDGLVLATKADPVPGGDFGGRRVLESFGDSTARLGVEVVDVYYLHDPERFAFSELVTPGGAVDQLVELRESGRVRAIGVAGGSTENLRRFVDLGVLDVVLHHNGYNLLDTSASTLVDEVRDAGLAFVNAAPYASGILAKPAAHHPRFRYGTPDEQTLRHTERLRAVCQANGVPLAALALQFSTRDPRIASTIVGVSSAARVDALVDNAALDIPAQAWTDLAEVLGFLPRAAAAAR